VNYISHYDLSYFRLLLKNNSHTFSGLILKINICYKGVTKELEKFRENGSRTHCLKGIRLL
jgi:hypothetical protein